MGYPPMRDNEKNRVPLPKSPRDVPRYLRQLLGGFFSRLFYTFSMVWKTGPWILITLLLISLFHGIMPIVGSLISKEILNELQTVISDRVAADLSGVAFIATFWGSMVMFLLIFYFLYRILNQIVTRLNASVTRIAGEKVVKYVRIQIMNKAKEIDLAAFDLPEFYEKLENANREAGMRPISILSSTFETISKAISLISYIVILATAPGMWWTAPIMLLLSLPTAIINFSYRQKNFKYMRRRSKDRRQMAYYSELMVNKDMVKEIRMFDLADEFKERYEGVFDHYYRGIRRLIIHESIWLVALTLVSSIANCIFFGLIAYRVFTGAIQIGDYSLYTGALTSISTTVASLITVSAQVYEGTLFIDNLIAFLDVKPTVVSSVDPPAKVLHGEPHTIEFVHVSFIYPGCTRKVLDDICLRFRPGETVVLVGLNGAGKTTLIKLLTRLYDPTEGYILLDGKDIREYDVKDLYALFGIIFQDFGKYAFSVKENIAFSRQGDPIDMDKIEEAANQSASDEFIHRLPDGYDTPLMRYFEKNGIELSIGQWQKLSVARAFYSESDILILDEPTASLDPMAEQEIFNQFDRLKKDKTTIFVSHRLSSATTANKIIVLKEGRVIEEGDHAALMAQKGEYYTLFSTQAKRYISSENESVREDNFPPHPHFHGMKKPPFPPHKPE